MKISVFSHRAQDTVRRKTIDIREGVTTLRKTREEKKSLLSQEKSDGGL